MKLNIIILILVGFLSGNTLWGDSITFQKADSLLAAPFGLEYKEDELFSLSNELTFEEKQELFSKHKSEDPWLFFGLNALLPGLALGSYFQGDFFNAAGINAAALGLPLLIPFTLLFINPIAAVSTVAYDLDDLFITFLVPVYIYSLFAPWIHTGDRNRLLGSVLGENEFDLAGIKRQGHHFDLSCNFRLLSLKVPLQVGYLYRFNNDFAIGGKVTLFEVSVIETKPQESQSSFETFGKTYNSTYSLETDFSEINNISLKAVFGNSVDSYALGFGIGLREIYGTLYCRNAFVDIGVFSRAGTFFDTEFSPDRLKSFINIGFSLYIGS